MKDMREVHHLGLDASNLKNNPLQKLGDMNYPQYNYDDRFTDPELKQFREMFQYFDRNGNEQMDVRDLPRAMRAMGALITDKEVKILA